MPPISLYIHIPWCIKKCPYCDFNSHAQQGQLPIQEYIAALRQDLAQDKHWLQERPIRSIFFGGGTPSLLPPSAIQQILDDVRAQARLIDNAEITLETNPGAIEHGSFVSYLAAGINRVSIGAQSFDEQSLKKLGRIHSALEIPTAIKQAQDAGITNINIDLMYALPDQSMELALIDLEQAIALQPTHISHYQLTLEPNTVFAKHPPPLPDDDQSWAMQEACQKFLAENNFAQYEVSAYAKPERQCAHNLNYWQFGDYLGIGAGAHGKVTQPDGGIIRYAKLKTPRSYLSAQNFYASRDAVDPKQLSFEFMLNALRLNQGFDLSLFETTTGLSIGAIEEPLAKALDNGWITLEQSRVGTTERGHNFLNDVIALFLP